MENTGRAIFEAENAMGMDALRVGAAAYIAAVEARGELRRRLVELGFFEGERVEKVLKSPLGDPSAYRVRGQVTAIRDGDAQTVRVCPIADGGKEKRAGDGDENAH